MTNKEARAKAKEAGYIEDKNPPIKSHGEIVFKDPKGRRWISADNAGHSGGVWKEFDSKFKRTGTLDKDFKKIKD